MKEGLFFFHLHKYIYMYTYKHTYLPTNIYDLTFLDFFISGIYKFPDLQKYGNSRSREIWKYWNHVCMYILYLWLWANMTVCIRHAWLCMYVSHRGVFQDNKVFCSCSGHRIFNDWANYQLNFIYFYWASQLLWYSEDGLTFCHMFCTHSGLYLYGLHPA